MRRSDIADRYLAALDLERHEPALPFLGDVIRRHVDRFPFSSVGPRLGEDLPLAAESLLDRIVVRRRGGYCFEQNGLLFEMLDELGFAVTLVLARVVFNRDGLPGLTHRLTLVDLGGSRFLVDVGFGPMGPPLPVPMDGTVVGRERRYRVHVLDDGARALQIEQDGSFASMYRFDLVRFGQADVEMGHFYSHKHPAATFVNNLVAARILDEEVRSLQNRDYRVIRVSGEVRRVVADAAELHALLTHDLGLAVTPTEADRLFRELPPASACV